MDADDLWTEARSMARPVVRLSSIASGSKPVGRFRGPPIVGAALRGKHVLSFDCGCLPRELMHPALRGTATLHEGDGDDFPPSEFAVIDRAIDFGALPAAREQIQVYAHLATADDDGARLVYSDLETHGVPLYAHADQSLPHIGDLLERGSPRVHAWLRSLGWDPKHRYNRNLDRRSPAAAEYDRRWWQDRYDAGETPKLLWSLPRGRTFAVLGGWPTPLRDEALPEGRLLLTVFAEEEPRRQVFLTDTGSFTVLDELA